MCMLIVLISPSAEFSRLHNLHPWYRNSLLYGLISSGENSAHFLQLMPFHNAISHFTILHFFFRSTRYPLLLGGQRRSGMRGFAQHLYTQVTSVIWGNWLLYHVLPFVSDRPLASINRCCTVIQGQWLVPLDPPDSDTIYALSKAEARTAVPSYGSQVLRPLNHDCWHDCYGYAHVTHISGHMHFTCLWFPC